MVIVMFLLLAKMLLLGRGAVNLEFCIRKAKRKRSQKRNYLMNRFNMNGCGFQVVSIGSAKEWSKGRKFSV
jgi:hypothetical protein